MRFLRLPCMFVYSANACPHVIHDQTGGTYMHMYVHKYVLYVPPRKRNGGNRVSLFVGSMLGKQWSRLGPLTAVRP